MDLSFLHSANEIAQTAFYIVCTGAGIVGTFFATGRINAAKVGEAFQLSVAKVVGLAEAGHFESIEQAIEMAFDIFRDLNGKKKISKKTARKIERRVKVEVDHLIDRDAK